MNTGFIELAAEAKGLKLGESTVFRNTSMDYIDFRTRLLEALFTHPATMGWKWRIEASKFHPPKPSGGFYKRSVTIGCIVTRVG